jgi:hypothetical protein
VAPKGLQLFKNEACALVELLLSDACPHPCLVVAGTIDPELIGGAISAKHVSRQLAESTTFLHRKYLLVDCPYQASLAKGPSTEIPTKTGTQRSTSFDSQQILLLSCLGPFGSNDSFPFGGI